MRCILFFDNYTLYLFSLFRAIFLSQFVIVFTQVAFEFKAYQANLKVNSIRFDAMIAFFLSYALNCNVFVVITSKALYNFARFIVYRYRFNLLIYH